MYAAHFSHGGHIPSAERIRHGQEFPPAKVNYHGHPLKFYNYLSLDLGRLPAIATIAQDIRDEYENVLILDAGDMNTDRPESNFYESAPDIIALVHMGLYDDNTLGSRRVATNSFMAAGGDGYSMMTEGYHYDTSAFQRDVVIDYIQYLGGTITPETEGRITVIE